MFRFRTRHLNTGLADNEVLRLTEALFVDKILQQVYLSALRM
jgi:hypothetical protein